MSFIPLFLLDVGAVILALDANSLKVGQSLLNIVNVPGSFTAHSSVYALTLSVETKLNLVIG